MDVRLRSLGRMVDYVLAVDREQFAQQYPGCYLVPMGLVTAEEIHSSSGADLDDDKAPETMSLHFEDDPRHRMGQPHPLAGELFQIAETGGQQFTLGRSKRCDLCVPDESVSEQHCRMEVVPEGLVVVDLGSTNGTSVNSRKLVSDEPELLSNGDMLTVGRYCFELLSAAALYSMLSLIRNPDA